MATDIVANIQGKNVYELGMEEWNNSINYFEELIQDEGDSPFVVLFNYTYPRTITTSMTMVLSSLSNLLLVASILESQPVPVPEVALKLFFKRSYGTLGKFSRCFKHLQYNNFIQMDSKDPPLSTGPPDKTWSLHAMRQMFIGIIKGSEVKSMGDMFLECNTQEEILVELLLFYGEDQWCDQATKVLGIPMCQIQNDSSQSRSLQLAAIKPFVLHADTREEWEENSHQLTKQIL